VTETPTEPTPEDLPEVEDPGTETEVGTDEEPDTEPDDLDH
jgi:hypothetical protein